MLDALAAGSSSSRGVEGAVFDIGGNEKIFPETAAKFRAALPRATLHAEYASWDAPFVAISEK